ncbi:MAG: DUF4350 domain-containing protein [Myxococcota bacterium]
MSGGVFNKRIVIALFAVVTISLVAAVIFGLAGPPQGDAESNGADAFSQSALGHRAFREVLDELDIPVLASRYRSADRAGSGVLIVAEPRMAHVPGAAGKLSDMLDKANRVIIVLPKRRGKPDPDNDDWLEKVYPVSRSEVDSLLTLLPGEYELVRVGGTPDNYNWTNHGLAADPSIDDPQLVESSDLEPLVESEDGILLGRVSTAALEEYRENQWDFEGFDDEDAEDDSEQADDPGRADAPGPLPEVLVLSDPDVLSNHGIDKGDNAAFSVNMVEYVRQATGPVVFDETLHGFESEPAFTRAIFEFPLVLITLNFVLLIIVAIWAGMGRFGKPREAEPAIAPGKRFLIDNTAQLLQTGGHDTHMLRRLAWAIVEHVGREIRAPSELERWERVRWIDKVNERRGLEFELEPFMKSIESLASGRDSARPATMLERARTLYEWKEDILHGY